MKSVRTAAAGLAMIAVVIGLWFALTSSADAEQGNYVRIMYVHVPSAWLAFLAFGVTALSSVLWLIRRRDRWDRLAAGSAELGVLFTGLALLTGSLWGRPVWGTFWDWLDPRMASTALMFFVYLGYLALRRSTPDPFDRARRSALVGVVAVIQVPLVYFSVDLWRSLHQPMTIRSGGVTLDPSMLAALLTNLGAFTLVYLVMLSARVRIDRLETAKADSPPLAGLAVTAPRLEELT